MIPEHPVKRHQQRMFWRWRRSIERWAACETYGLATEDDDHHAEQPRAVTAVIAAAAAHLMGDADWDTPERVTYDGITPSTTILAWHLNETINAVNDAFRGAKVRPVKLHEPSGLLICDDTARDADDRRGFVGIVVDPAPPAPWLSIADVTERVRFENGGRAITWAGLTVARRARHRVTATFEKCDADGLRAVAETWHGRRSAIIEGARATRSPGTHCSRCPVAGCAVRGVARRP